MTVPSGAQRLLAVPALGETAGGVGQVSALLWRVMAQTWRDEAAIVRLTGNGRVTPTLGDKLGFGCRLGARQVARRARWILFGHLGLARVQRYVPPMTRAPYAVFLHGVEAWDRLAEHDRRLLAGARLRVANSGYTARRVLDANPDVGTIEVCPLALAETPAVPNGSSARDAAGRTVLIVGRLSAGERYKGHEELIAAWPDVVAVHPDAELVIVGDGDDRARLEARAREGGAGHRIRFAGFVSRGELDALYERAALFAMPSRSEGFGLVYLEAMAHRLPCIGSVLDAAGEIIRHGETGLLVDPSRVDQVTRAILDLLASPDARRRMGQAGHDRWRQCFGFDRFSGRARSLLADAFEVSPS